MCRRCFSCISAYVALTTQYFFGGGRLYLCQRPSQPITKRAHFTGVGSNVMRSQVRLRNADWMHFWSSSCTTMFWAHNVVCPLPPLPPPPHKVSSRLRYFLPAVYCYVVPCTVWTRLAPCTLVPSILCKQLITTKSPVESQCGSSLIQLRFLCVYSFEVKKKNTVEQLIHLDTKSPRCRELQVSLYYQSHQVLQSQNKVVKEIVFFLSLSICA